MKTLKIRESTHDRLVKIRAKLTLENGKTRTFDEIINILIDGKEEK